MKTFILLVLLFSLFSCGKKTSAQLQSQEYFENLRTEMNGIYHTELSPMNSPYEKVRGAVTVSRDGDEFVIDVSVINGPVNSFHPQHIHIGKRCPTLEMDDLNLDGHIDAYETSLVVGDSIIPIDDDISSQWLGLGTYPASDEFGNFYWARSTSYQKMLSDLREEDINFEDGIVKISQDDLFNVEGFTVVIYGADKYVDLPESVANIGRLNKYQGYPVACGVLREVKHSPGKIDDDTSEYSKEGSINEDDGTFFNE